MKIVKLKDKVKPVIQEKKTSNKSSKKSVFLFKDVIINSDETAYIKVFDIKQSRADELLDICKNIFTKTVKNQPIDGISVPMLLIQLDDHVVFNTLQESVLCTIIMCCAYTKATIAEKHPMNALLELLKKQ